MCYAVYVSTDCDKDLSTGNSELVRFERVGDPGADPCISLLSYPNRWYVGSKSGCSCMFRHLHSVDLGFGEPVDWYKEEQDELSATAELYRALEPLLLSGRQVDLLDRWEGAKPDDIKILDVSLDDVSEQAFRMFENQMFRLTKGKNKEPTARAE
jgi:hypothetical protein